MKKVFIFIMLAGYCLSSKAQSIGSKVSFLGTDGKTYTGTVNEIQGNRYKIKYDNYNFEAWATAAQLTVLNNAPADNAEGIGSKVSFTANDGKNYTGTVKAIQGNQYKIAYNGMNFEAWLTRDQFSFTAITHTQQPQQTTKSQYSAAQNATLQDLENIFEFGKAKGWASLVHENKFQQFTNGLSAQDIKNMVGFINQAKTASAKFFVLKSWLAGDYIAELQTFIDQLNTVSETVQQEKCLVSSHHSIIQQWQQSCSVTVVQTYLGDLCPRYVWGLKQIQNYDVLDHDSKSATAQQQKWLLEKYGGVVSVRGDNSGKQIPINDPLNELVGKILGLHFSTQQVTTSIPNVFTKVRSELDKGLDVPLLIGFVGTDARHFILVMKYRYVQGGFQYQVYDPWDGLCDYVSESTIQQGSLSPLFPGLQISIDYYYTAD